MNKKNKIIAIEEHYFDPDLTKHFSKEDALPIELQKQLEDVDELRLKEMDDAGVDVQVLSLAPPATQCLGADSAATIAKHTNDRLAEIVQTHPDRFAGFAALPTADPTAAAQELERTVNDLGFKGAMIHGLTNNVFLDDKRFWPIFERAASLDVPIYLHPGPPHPEVVKAYYQDYL